MAWSFFRLILKGLQTTKSKPLEATFGLTFFCLILKGLQTTRRHSQDFFWPSHIFSPFWGNLSRKCTTIFSKISTENISISTFGRKLCSFVWQEVTLKVTRFTLIYTAKKLWLKITL